MVEYYQNMMEEMKGIQVIAKSIQPLVDNISDAAQAALCEECSFANEKCFPCEILDSLVTHMVSSLIILHSRWN